MAQEVQLRRGTTTEHNTFTGAAGELTVDTTKNTAVIHDGSTAGGYPLGKASGPEHIAVTDGALAAGDKVIVLANGKVQKVSSSSAYGFFGPTTTGLFQDWNTAWGFRFYEMCSRLWTYHQTLSSPIFSSENDMKSAALDAMKDSNYGVHVHADGSGGYGNFVQFSITTSNVYSDYYIFQTGYNLISSGGTGSGSTWSNLFNWMDYKQLVFRFETLLTTTNLTTGNWIGMSDGVYSDGATASIKLRGHIDDTQTGLTAGNGYYVQGDGTLGVTAGDPSVFAGIALSSTKLLISV